jgi:hypothetical protein
MPRRGQYSRAADIVNVYRPLIELNMDDLV